MDTFSPQEALDLFKSALRIRKVELKIEELYSEDEMKTPVHLSLGQEAVAVGICAHLSKDDYVFSNHRSHAHYLAKAGDLKKMIAELYCKETGCSKGRGGSMHLIDPSVGLLGSSSIVSGSIPHAVGAAFAIRMRKEKRIAVSFFGDAASEQGAFYESMNLATLKQLPVLFVCENNRYSVCSNIHSRQAMDNISMRPRAFDIPAVKVDGMDLEQVFRKSKEATEHVRSGRGPYFMECCVQRWRAHAGAGDPLKELYRQPEELQNDYWRCSVDDFRSRIIKEKIADENKLTSMEAEIDKEIDQAFDFAQKSPLPKKEELHKYLFME